MRKVRRDTVAGLIQAAQSQNETVNPPEGVVLSTQTEETLWRQYTGARQADAWRDVDLLQLAKIVHLDIQIARLTTQIDADGITQDGGAPHPLFKVTDALEKQRLALCRFLALGVKSNAAIALNDSAPTRQKKAKAEEGKTPSLLA